MDMCVCYNAALRVPIRPMIPVGVDAFAAANDVMFAQELQNAEYMVGSEDASDKPNDQEPNIPRGANGLNRNHNNPAGNNRNNNNHNNNINNNINNINNNPGALRERRQNNVVQAERARDGFELLRQRQAAMAPVPARQNGTISRILILLLVVAIVLLLLRKLL